MKRHKFYHVYDALLRDKNFYCPFCRQESLCWLPGSDIVEGDSVQPSFQCSGDGCGVKLVATNPSTFIPALAAARKRFKEEMSRNPVDVLLDAGILYDENAKACRKYLEEEVKS